MKQKKLLAFTLAETLMCIGILGVVTAMAIPTLVTYTSLAKYRTQFKKSVATLSNASRQGQADYDIDYAATNTPCNETTAENESPLEILSFCSLFNAVMKARYVGPVTNFSGYAINVPDVGEVAELPGSTAYFDTDVTKYLAYELPEGTTVVFQKNAHACSLYDNHNMITDSWLTSNPQCIGYIDLNGAKAPNRIVNCPNVSPTAINVKDNCEVTSDMAHLTDIYPIIFHDATVIPATPAATNVLLTARRTMATDRAWIDDHTTNH